MLCFTLKLFWMVVVGGEGVKTFITETYTTKVIMTTIVTMFMILDPMVIQGVANSSLGETVYP